MCKYENYAPFNIPNSPQYTLVLDIDETLVHCSTQDSGDCDLVLDVGGMEVYVRTR